MQLDNKNIKDILLNGNYVSGEDAEKVKNYKEKSKESLMNYVVSEGIVNKDIMGQALAEHFKVPYADLNSYPPVREQALKIPEEVAKKFMVALFKEDEKTAIITTSDPSQKNLGVKIKSLLPNKKITVNYSLPEDIESVFIHYRKALDTRFIEIIKSQKRIAPEIIEEIIGDALSYNASDIHFEPQNTEVLVRFRVDGVMQEAGRLPKEYYGNIVNKIKVQANLRIDKHRSTQDGAIRLTKDGKEVDMRISIAPTVNGEKIVIRLLSSYIRNFSLSDLGLSKENEKQFVRASRKPFGMILVVGPTGSGKSTSLYSLLKLLNHPEVNITTIEDPVEYKISGISQIQVNTEAEITFATGLRSIVRQDPDIILVGEIRDEETAEIAVNAALTGHLLFSTFHANNAATSIPRLLDIGIQPFLLSSTLELIVAQRLVRRICEECRYSYKEKRSNLEHLIPGAKKYFNKEDVVLYKGKGCSSCSETGYKGRIAVFEFISMTPEMKDLILKSPSTNQIWELAQTQGALSLFDDGIQKIKTGITSLDELLRVVPSSN